MRYWIVGLLAATAVGCGSGTDICSQAGTCSKGGTYQSCTPYPVPGNEYYKTSDGTVFTCASTTDCNAAASQVAAWCNAH